MQTLPLAMLAIAGAIAILFGIKYSLAREFMPYHATVAGRTWPELQPGVQAIILGMYRIMGGGFITYGLALVWLLVPLDDQQVWAAIAALTLTITAIVPVLYVTLWLQHVQPEAKTPVLPAAVVFILAASGAGIALMQR